MSNLSLVEAKLPPGFRFHPRDEELICDYLMKKIALCDQYPLLIEVDLNKCEPWDIPETACVGGKEWYFYSQHDRKYTTGLRTNRATMSGYWKATGKDRQVIRRGTLVGMRKTLVFYQGRAPKGRRTEWVMNEFRLQGPLGPIKASPFKEDWVLCRVFYKNRDLSNKQDTLSLPSLVNPNYNHIIFDYHQTQTQTQTQYEQVPYFSIFNPTNCHIINQMGPTKSFKTSIEANPNITSLLNTSMYRDNKFKSEFLNHFAKVESKGSTSLGEGSSESFLSEVGGMPSNVWNNY